MKTFVLKDGEWIAEEFDGSLDTLPSAAQLGPSRPPMFDPPGQFKWLDASSAEGSEVPPPRLSDANIFQLAEHFAARKAPQMIDGGPGSKVHGSLDDTSTPANGWVHKVAVVDDGSGPRLKLRAELNDLVYDDVARGRLALGSVAFSGRLSSDGASFDDVSLRSFALTNDPANQSLIASTHVRSATDYDIERTHIVSKKTNEIAVARAAELAAADAPVEEAPAEAEAEVADADEQALVELQAQVAELLKRVDELEALNVAVSAERNALVEESQARAAEAVARSADDAVDAAIKSGKILAAAREQYLDVARKSGVDAFEKMTAGLRTVQVGRQTSPRDSVGEQIEARAIVAASAEDAQVIANLRAAGFTDAQIARRR